MQTSPVFHAPGQPRVSVMIRSMDRDDLQHALASVAQQTYPHIEVVVVAAKPGHRELAPLCGTYPLRLIDTPHPLSRSQAANQALTHAQGQYLIFLDDDDWFMPQHIHRLVTLLCALPHTLAAYTGVELVDAQGHPMGHLDHPFDRIRLQSGNLMPIHAVLFHRSLVEQGCRFDENLDLFEDWDFWLQVAAKTSFAHLPESSAVYRVHDSSGVHVKSDQRDQAQNTLTRKWLQEHNSEQLIALLRRVWLANDFERQCQQLSTELATLRNEQLQQQAAQKEQLSALQHQLALSQQSEHLQRDALKLVNEQQRSLAQTNRRYQAALLTVDKLRQQHTDLIDEKVLLIQQANTAAVSAAEQIRSLQSSKSWQVTAPLRWLSRLLRGNP
jgi:Glycosyl transferase family 2